MSNNHWSEYWKTGVLTSLPSDFKENYDGELYEYWESVLLAQQTSLRVLDVCTGNGAVAILLTEIAHKHNLSIEMVAVDASDIQPHSALKAFPQKKAAINAINFIGNCLVEAMADSVPGEFDLIVSQYGIEYCDTSQAAVNILQKLKPNGQFVFVAHSPNTAMLDYMQIEQQIFQYLSSLDVFLLFNDFSHDKISANKFKNKLEQGLQLMSQQHQYKSQQLFNTWGQTMYQLLQMNNAELKKQQEKIGQFALSHIYAKNRAHDMLNVSSKLINNPQWYQPFITAGLALQKEGEITYQGKHNVGHFYEFKK